jgi:hypothetical protein
MPAPAPVPAPGIHPEDEAIICDQAGLCQQKKI